MSKEESPLYSAHAPSYLSHHKESRPGDSQEAPARGERTAKSLSLVMRIYIHAIHLLSTSRNKRVSCRKATTTLKTPEMSKHSHNNICKTND